ncbi:MAG: DUF1569 domain-containing protein [Thermoanaerobaculia bacterium]
MHTIFDPADRKVILDRLAKLSPGSPRQWGKMNPGQMLAHCSAALETATGVRPMKQALIGKVLAPFVRAGVLGDKPFTKNSPTDPTFIVKDDRDFAAERVRLEKLLESFCQRGPEEAGKQTHSFFGKLTGAEWGRLAYKHLDHHLSQFNA